MLPLFLLPLFLLPLFLLPLLPCRLILFGLEVALDLRRRCDAGVRLPNGDGDHQADGSLFTHTSNKGSLFGQDRRIGASRRVVADVLTQHHLLATEAEERPTGPFPRGPKHTCGKHVGLRRYSPKAHLSPLTGLREPGSEEPPSRGLQIASDVERDGERGLRGVKRA